MYEAKAAGKNRWVEFDEAMEIELGKQAALEAEIRHGIQAGEFVPYFQPIYELASGEVKGFEALARWQHPAKGLLEPAEFLSVAESSGLIGEISLSIMHQTLLAAKDWPAHLKIAVNMSAVQFKDPLLAQRLLRLLTQINFRPAGSSWKYRKTASSAARSTRWRTSRACRRRASASSSTTSGRAMPR